MTSRTFSQASGGFKANTHTIRSRQPLPQPEMTLKRPLERQLKQQEAERIRGGCCLCPGGSVWVCTSRLSEQEDDQTGKVVLAQQMGEVPRPQAAQGPPPTSPTTLDSASSPQSLQSRKFEPLEPSARKTVQSLPIHRDELQSPPPSRQAGRPIATTLPSQAYRPDLPQHQRPGPRIPAQSSPMKPSGIR